MPAVGSRFSRGTTVAALTEWWLDSVARHQVKTSTLDSYRKFAGYLADDIGAHAVVDVGLTHPRPDRLDPVPELARDALHRRHASPSARARVAGKLLGEP